MTTATYPLTETAIAIVHVGLRHVKAKAQVEASVNPFYDGFGMEADVRVERIERVWVGGKEISNESHPVLWELVEEKAKELELDTWDLEEKAY